MTNLQLRKFLEQYPDDLELALAQEDGGGYDMVIEPIEITDIRIVTWEGLNYIGNVNNINMKESILEPTWET